MNFTVLGATGFIGAHQVQALQEQGHAVFAPARGDAALFTQPLGHVLYCVGLTADFRERPYETVDAHVGLLRDVLARADFGSLLYLSSTRVYAGAGTAREESTLLVDPQAADSLYNLSKLLGESLCFATGRPVIRVVRLSNVVGDDPHSPNFLASIVRDAVHKGRVQLMTQPSSAKDYVTVADVVALLPRIAQVGKARLYNVASGQNTRHSQLLDQVKAATGCRVDIAPYAPLSTFAPIAIDRIQREFDFNPSPIGEAVERLIARVKENEAGHAAH